jgi:hypothetical protein
MVGLKNPRQTLFHHQGHQEQQKIKFQKALENSDLCLAFLGALGGEKASIFHFC